MNVTLRLIHQREAALPTGAWFIPGNDPQTWLKEILGWGIPTSHIALYPVPRSGQDLIPCGMLAVIEGNPTIHPTPHVHPYCCLVPGFYLPVDGKIAPPVKEAELAELCSYQVSIFHPTAGLVGCDAEDIVRVEHLLQAPIRRESPWKCPHPGVARPMALRTLVRLMVPDPGEMLDQGKEDIGGEPMADIPIRPGEPSTNPFATLWRWLCRAIAELGLSITALVPHTAPSPTWVNYLEDFFVRLGGKTKASFVRGKDRELDRLLDLLRNNPEEGLKFAIPLANNDSRGMTESLTSYLAQRAVEFTLGNMGGGRAASTICLHPAQYNELRRLYTQAANLELAAGRYRRAAYIFASLLNDYRLAAQALRQGRYYLEAVVLYREFTNQPYLAAECLMEGGLLEEAAALFEELESWEKAGDLYVRLGDEGRAQSNFRLAVDGALKYGNPLLAADLLDYKIGSPDEALELLALTWPQHQQAEKCLNKRFSILGRLGRHKSARDLLEGLVVRTEVPSQAVIVIRTCADLLVSYPDPRVRLQAADGARVAAGRNLPHARLTEVQNLTEALRAIDPDDDLLLRDTQRFPHLKPITAEAYQPQVKTGFRVIPFKYTEYADITHWAAGLTGEGGFLACGFRPGYLGILQSDWNTRYQHLEWDLPEASRSILDAHDFTVSLHLDQTQNPGCMVHVVCGGSWPRIQEQRMYALWGSEGALGLGTPPWLPPDILCMSSGLSHEVWILRYVDQAYRLGRYSGQGHILAQYELGNLEIDSEIGGGPLPCRLAVSGSSVFASVGVSLFSSADDFQEWEEIFDFALDLTLSGKHQGERLAVSHATGITLVWLKKYPSQIDALNLTAPLVLFLPIGALIVVGATVSGEFEGRVYNTTKGKVVLRGTFKVRPQRPAVLMQGQDRSCFAILYDGGLMEQYRVEWY